MATIDEIIKEGRPAVDIIADLKDKSVCVPPWRDLEKEYNPKKHPVTNKAKYPDIINDDGTIDYVTRITYDLMRLAARRMSELCFGTPVKRIYKATTDKEKEAAKILEAIMECNRIDAFNIERGEMLFSGCEVMTLWYAVENKNNLYGIESPIKIRCRNFSPVQGMSLYPLFDEYGDYIAMSVGYKLKKNKKSIEYFDTYTDKQHVKWMDDGAGWTLEESEKITIQKNPTLYTFRPTPIWENTADLVYEMEWAVSRNGNYLRKNSKPAFIVFADEEIKFGSEKDEKSEFKTLLQFPKGSDARYVTWPQAVENLKFFVQELRQMFFTQLQLPDWSYENMKSSPMSGEARKQMFIDAHLKVRDESGRLLEFLGREMNVVKAFAKMIAPKLEKEIDSMKVEILITPFSVSDDKDTINNLVSATAGKPIMSQREAVANLGWTDDIDKTMKELAEEASMDVFELSK